MDPSALDAMTKNPLKREPEKKQKEEEQRLKDEKKRKAADAVSSGEDGDMDPKDLRDYRLLLSRLFAIDFIIIPSAIALITLFHVVFDSIPVSTPYLLTICLLTVIPSSLALCTVALLLPDRSRLLLTYFVGLLSILVMLSYVFFVVIFGSVLLSAHISSTSDHYFGMIYFAFWFRPLSFSSHTWPTDHGEILMPLAY